MIGVIIVGLIIFWPIILLIIYIVSVIVNAVRLAWYYYKSNR
jgi:hypothetical protein